MFCKCLFYIMLPPFPDCAATPVSTQSRRNRSGVSMRAKPVEAAPPLEGINKTAAREKSIRHGHHSTLHLWWAQWPVQQERGYAAASADCDLRGLLQEAEEAK